MVLNLFEKKQPLPLDLDSIADLILTSQKESGEIPWCVGEKTDPWDHVESAMGLSTSGCFREAKKAFKWMRKMQLDDGSWYVSYKDGIPIDTTRDANMSSYIAVGVLHHYLITGDDHLLEEMWPTVQAAINFALRLQAPEGQIHWAISPQGEVDTMALLTGSSSVYMSIKCALLISKLLGCDMPEWQQGLCRLEHAILHKPYCFNPAKSRYSMDWFYPILSGALVGEKAKRRIETYWKKFVIEGQGVRCVSDQPWVTVAETCELSLALSAMGDLDRAETLFSWIKNKTNEDGSYWCGFTCPDMTIWPEDKSTWTNAVVLIAADAIYNLTPASRIFNHHYWRDQDLFPDTIIL